jgi:hypothetical protein
VTPTTASPGEPTAAYGGAANDPMDGGRIDALLHRLDTALGLDGRLL